MTGRDRTTVAGVVTIRCGMATTLAGVATTQPGSATTLVSARPPA
jgi:hypothetical protein